MAGDKSLKIAIVGGGVDGIVAAYVLQKAHNVTLFEQNDYLGGHTNTITIPDGPDAGTAVDTGFIVFNDKTYPNFHRFLSKLHVPVRYSCMSFGYYSEETGLCYSGTGINGLFAQRKNIIDPNFWLLLREISRFCKDSLQALEEGILDGLSLGEFLARHSYSRAFRDHYLLPISAAIWSSSDEAIMEYPAQSFVRFFKNHGLLSLRDRPRWQTVVGGSQSYVRAFKESFAGAVHLSTVVRRVSREPEGVWVHPEAGSPERFDKLVLAAHADQSLKLLDDACPEERDALGAWSYSRNRTVLHTYHEILPPNKRAWASWNYRRGSRPSADGPVFVTYHMNRLQGLKTVGEYCVTLNPKTPIPEDRIVREIEYTHPVFSNDALLSQEKLRTLNGSRNTFYCGSYMANGFHEDAVCSALQVGHAFGLGL
jgi:uncharacterized protein